MRLALKMGRTVQELEYSMSSVEFSQWLAFYDLEPFGPQAEGLQLGIIAALINNITSKNQRQPSDFCLGEQEKKSSESKTAEFLSNLSALAIKKNG